MQKVNKRVMIIAVLISLITTSLIYLYIKEATNKEKKVEYVKVPVASKDLPPRHKISNSDIELKEVMPAYIHKKAVLNQDEIIGKYLSDKVIKGEQMIQERLIEEENSNIVFYVPYGKRAISISVNEYSAVGYLIRPGDFVDIIMTLDMDENFDTKHKKLAKIIVENAKILAVGSTKIKDEKISVKSPKTVTLSVSKDDIEKIVYCEEFGTLRLALRSTGDGASNGSDGIIRKDLVPEKSMMHLPVLNNEE